MPQYVRDTLRVIHITVEPPPLPPVPSAAAAPFDDEEL